MSGKRTATTGGEIASVEEEIKIIQKQIENIQQLIDKQMRLITGHRMSDATYLIEELTRLSEEEVQLESRYAEKRMEAVTLKRAARLEILEAKRREEQEMYQAGDGYDNVSYDEAEMYSTNNQLMDDASPPANGHTYLKLNDYASDNTHSIPSSPAPTRSQKPNSKEPSPENTLNTVSRPKTPPLTRMRSREGVTVNELFEKWEIQPSEIEVKDPTNDLLGSGTFGKVWRAKCRGIDVAVKKIHNEMGVTSAQLENFRKECETICKLRHPNIALCMAACLDPNNLMMVMEYLPNGSVYDLLHRRQHSSGTVSLAYGHSRSPSSTTQTAAPQPSPSASSASSSSSSSLSLPNTAGPNPSSGRAAHLPSLTLVQKLYIARDTALGMTWLHRAGYVHLDLKTANLMLDTHMNVKIADFGLTRLKRDIIDAKGKLLGTPVYIAPEILEGSEFTEKVDVYSYGIILWELFTEKQPFMEDNHPRYNTLSALIRGVVEKGDRPTIPPNCPYALKMLIQRCWDAEPRNRPSFAEIVDHKVIEEIIVDVSFSEANYLGNRLWKTNFLGQDRVPWRNFARAFKETIFRSDDAANYDEQMWLLMRLLRVANDDDMVLLDRFADLLEWFGPLEQEDAFLRRLEHEVRHDWFWGDITKDEAEILLSAQKVGTYLVRFSSQTWHRGSFALSVRDKHGVRHYRITHRVGDDYVMQLRATDQIRHRSLVKLLERCKQSKFQGVPNFKTPCPGSPYAPPADGKIRERTPMTSGYLTL